MSYLVHQLPPLQLLLRSRYMFLPEERPKDFPEYLKCTLVSCKSLIGRALEFQVHTEMGFLRDKLPISALCVKQCEELPLAYCQRWNCQAYSGTVYVSPLLEGCKVKTLDKYSHTGSYLFTADLQHTSDNELHFSDSLEPEEHKAMHIIALSSGQLVAFPNNSLLFLHPTKTPNPLDKNPGFRVCNEAWSTNEFNETRSATSHDWNYDLGEEPDAD